MNGEAYEVHNAHAPATLLFLCDHASNKVPPELGTLGLSPSEFAFHIAFDIGADALSRALSERFGAPGFFGRWSRLVADLNRSADDPTVVAKLSDERTIPSNIALDAQGVAQRLARYHAPYHEAINAKVAEAQAAGIVPILISIHSFTPIWRGNPRPWHIGILRDRDGRLALPLLARLTREADLLVGDNEPYSGALEGDCLYRHGTMNGLPHVLIEIRQDMIADAAGVARMAARLEEALRDALRDLGPPTILYSRPLAFASGGPVMDEKTRAELEAATFRRLVAHLRGRTDVQNIDMMNLAGFCRNCLGDWYREAAAAKGIVLEKNESREIVYGMPPSEWNRHYQTEASPEAQAAFAKAQKTHS